MSERDKSGKFVEGHDSPGPGRSSKYKEEYAVLAYKFCLLGAVDSELAQMFDVHEATINKWKKDHPAFYESTWRGKAEADAEIAHSLFHRAKGYCHEATHISIYEGAVTETQYTKRYPPDTKAASLWLRNRQPARWREKQEIVMNNDIIPVIVNEPDWLTKPEKEDDDN